MALEEQVVCLTDKKRRSGKENSGGFWSSVTLEPMWFGVCVSFMISVVAYKNLFLQRACLVDLGYSEEQCLRSKGQERQRIEVECQRVVSSTLVGSGLASSLLTLSTIVLLAPWSDSSGRRRPLVLLSIAGLCGGTLVLLLASCAWPRLPVAWLIYAHAAPVALGGNFNALMLAAFSYLGDLSYKTGRCLLTTVGSNVGFFAVSMAVGTVLGPILYRCLGFAYMFLACLLLELSSLAYAAYAVNDLNVSEKVPRIFDLTLPWQAIKCFAKKRNDYMRRNVVLVSMVPCTNSLMFVTEIQLAYLFLRNKFSWTEVEYSAFLTLKNIFYVIGSAMIVRILKKRMKMKDKYIGVVGAVSSMLSTIVLMCSNGNVMIFISCVVGVLSRGVMIAEKPILVRQIAANEQGKICCVTTIVEKVLLSAFIPLCTHLYAVTLDWFPSSFLLISVAVSAIQIVCFALIRESLPANEIALEKM